MASFRDRSDAGRRLVGPAAAVLPTGRPVTVVALPRGGVLVGATLVEGLRALGWTARLDLVVVAKVLAPEFPELALGAVTAHATVRSSAAGQLTGMDDARYAALTADARRRLAGRAAALPEPHAPADGSVLLVDDGLATGSTVVAAVAELRSGHPGWLGLAVPVADATAWARVRPLVDGGVALLQRTPMRAVSVDYADFTQLDDDVVRDALARWG
ncbi:phosphoribosyltransferase family protein [Modestobacter altitudinis]|uniref:phosphoribosyltransferase family protein n=1 Tax=Modestobacter altitudinis TaxID=2213158 RepID=UPI0014869980|nr:phosphoribosyltransferase family protein [Modestobacter altitudinis]